MQFSKNWSNFDIPSQSYGDFIHAFVPVSKKYNNFSSRNHEFVRNSEEVVISGKLFVNIFHTRWCIIYCVPRFAIFVTTGIKLPEVFSFLKLFRRFEWFCCKHACGTIRPTCYDDKKGIIPGNVRYFLDFCRIFWNFHQNVGVALFCPM